MKVVIKRAEWLCGLQSHAFSDAQRASSTVGTHLQAIVTEDGEKKVKRCCLGHLGLACGVPREDLAQANTLAELRDCFTRGPAWSWSDLFPHLWRDLDLDAQRVNDDAALLPEEREERLIKLFRSHGHELSFVD